MLYSIEEINRWENVLNGLELATMMGDDIVIFDNDGQGYSMDEYRHALNFNEVVAVHVNGNIFTSLSRLENYLQSIIE